MWKTIGFLAVIVIAAGIVHWAGQSDDQAARQPTAEQINDANILVQRCAHVPHEQMDACTMREYQKLHPDAP